MNRFIRNSLSQFFIFLLVVQTLNLSINSAGFYMAENTTNSAKEQDYVDSMIEFVVENILDFSTHTFHDKASAYNFSKQQHINVHFDLKWLPGSALCFDNNEIIKELDNNVPKNEKIINLYYKEVPAKPPQVLSA